MGHVLHLVQQAVSKDTVDALEFLLQEARAGRVIGLAYVALHNSHDYTVDMAGFTKTAPSLTRGAVHTLDDELAALIRKPDPRQA